MLRELGFDYSALADLGQVAAIGLALSLDWLIGDPWTWLHPVQVMGSAIQWGRQRSLALTRSPQGRRIAGVILGLTLIGGSAGIAWVLVWGAAWISPGLGVAMETVILASSLAGRSLAIAAQDVLTPLQQGDLVTARQRLSRYVGRDTANLSEAEIYRAVFETVAENATDGVTAPLFYLLLGSLLPGIGGAPLAWGYKAASTLDSMIGYRRPLDLELGWFSARLEDGLTWLPCRLTVVTIAFLSGQPRRVIRLCRRDAIADPSPNSGWSECAYAAALNVQVGGQNTYQGVVTWKPKLGDDLQPITRDRITRALQLTRWTIWLWFGLRVAAIGLG